MIEVIGGRPACLCPQLALTLRPTRTLVARLNTRQTTPFVGATLRRAAMGNLSGTVAALSTVFRPRTLIPSLRVQGMHFRTRQNARDVAEGEVTL